MWNKDFWLGNNGALTRCARTFAQTAIAMITVASFSPFDIGQWRNAAIVSGTAALVSLLMSLDRREASVAAAPSPALSVAPAVASYDSPADNVGTTTFAPGVYGCGDSIR